MIYRIFEQDAEILLAKPETGMGYQIVNASQYNRTQIKEFIIYNTNLAIELDANYLTNRKKIINEGYINVFNSANQLMLETSSIKVLGKSTIREFIALDNTKKRNKKRHDGGKGATDYMKEYANGLEYFVRISAYEDDKRIDFQKMKLKAGSFTTTFVDYNDCVTTSDEPIDRYALPNEERIEWAFYIRPVKNDILQRGIVQPAFKHAGGGIEAYFELGTSEGSYLQKKEYGK